MGGRLKLELGGKAIVKRPTIPRRLDMGLLPLTGTIPFLTLNVIGRRQLIT